MGQALENKPIHWNVLTRFSATQQQHIFDLAVSLLSSASRIW